MKHSALLVLALGLAVASTSAGQADPGTAPFGCDARVGQTCYFKIYYAPNRTRIVQLLTGMKVNIPGLNIGRTYYCVSVSTPPANKCSQKRVNATYND